jgi:hypothetical protein
LNVTGSTECINDISANHILISREKSQSVDEKKFARIKLDFSREINWSQTDRLRFHEILFLIFFQVLLNVTGSTECIDDIAANHVLVNILHVLYTLPEHRVVALDLLYAVAGDTRLVKESLLFGKFFCF